MDPLQNLCTTVPKAGTPRLLCIAGVAVATFLALGAFASRASADLPSVPGSAVVDEATQAATPVTDQFAPMEQAAAPAVQPVTQAAAPAVDQATQAAAPAVDQAAQATAPAVDQVARATAPAVRSTTEAAAPVVNNVARATSQLSRSATDQASRLSDNLVSAGQGTSRSAGALTGGGSANGQPAARHGISTPAMTQAPMTPSQPGGVAPQRHHSFSLADPASPQLALTQTDGVRQAFAADRSSPSTGSGSESGRQPGGRPSPAPAPLQVPATQEGAVATSGSSGGLGASGAIIFTFILAASLGLRRLSLAPDPLGPAPLVLLPERPG